MGRVTTCHPQPRPLPLRLPLSRPPTSHLKEAVDSLRWARGWLVTTNTFMRIQHNTDTDTHYACVSTLNTHTYIHTQTHAHVHTQTMCSNASFCSFMKNPIPYIVAHSFLSPPPCSVVSMRWTTDVTTRMVATPTWTSPRHLRKRCQPVTRHTGEIPSSCYLNCVARTTGEPSSTPYALYVA